jgi:hypothetical protein
MAGVRASILAPSSQSWFIAHATFLARKYVYPRFVSEMLLGRQTAIPNLVQLKALNRLRQGSDGGSAQSICKMLPYPFLEMQIANPAHVPSQL